MGRSLKVSMATHSVLFPGESMTESSVATVLVTKIKTWLSDWAHMHKYILNVVKN